MEEFVEIEIKCAFVELIHGFTLPIKGETRGRNDLGLGSGFGLSGGFQLGLLTARADRNLPRLHGFRNAPDQVDLE